MNGDAQLAKCVQMRQRAMQAAEALDSEHRYKRALAHAKRRYTGEFFTGQPVWY